MPTPFNMVKLSMLTNSFILWSKMLVVALYDGMMKKKEQVKERINRVYNFGKIS